MILSHRLFMLVFCVYSLACAADPTVDIMKWVESKEATKYGSSVKIDPEAKTHELYYIGMDPSGHYCRVSFLSKDDRADVKEVRVSVGRITPSEEADDFELSVSSTLRANWPMIYGDLNLDPVTQKLSSEDPEKPVTFNLVTKDLYFLHSGFGFSYVATEKPKGYETAHARDPQFLAVDTRILFDFKAIGTDEENQYPDLDKVEAYDLSGKNPYKPVYTCYLP